MKYCEKCPAKDGNFDIIVMTSCGTIRCRKRGASQTLCSAERVKVIIHCAEIKRYFYNKINFNILTCILN